MSEIKSPEQRREELASVEEEIINREFNMGESSCRWLSCLRGRLFYILCYLDNSLSTGAVSEDKFKSFNKKIEDLVKQIENLKSEGEMELEENPSDMVKKRLLEALVDIKFQIDQIVPFT